ncbi:MAG: hypothetical protein Q8O13_00380 [Candidatus Omnitrophota bacterium]|nr:hypothetical protein [Candidatus Omnitrophota bacterium]
MEEKSKIDKADYWSDGKLYTVWKYLNGGGPLRTKDVFRFWDITPAGGSVDDSASGLIWLLRSYKEKLSGIRFNKKSYPKIHSKEHEGKIISINKKLEAETSKAVEKILSNKFSIDDISTICGSGKSSIIKSLEFDRKIPEKTRDKLSKYIDRYIEDFIENLLYTSRKNYYKFEKQKDITLLSLRESVKKYGNDFTIEYGKNTAEFASWDEKYLFIHSLIALERLKYLNINGIWVYDFDDPLGESYKAEITVEKKCFPESSPRNKKTKRAEGSKSTVFDEKQSKIKHGSKELKIPYGTIEYCLCRILFKESVGKPVSWDEVADECDGARGLDERKTEFRSVYDAYLRLNDKARQKLGIKKLCEWKKMTVFRVI